MTSPRHAREALLKWWDNPNPEARPDMTCTWLVACHTWWDDITPEEREQRMAAVRDRCHIEEPTIEEAYLVCMAESANCILHAFIAGTIPRAGIKREIKEHRHVIERDQEFARRGVVPDYENTMRPENRTPVEAAGYQAMSDLMAQGYNFPSTALTVLTDTMSYEMIHIFQRYIHQREEENGTEHSLLDQPVAFQKAMEQWVDGLLNRD